MRLLCAKAGCDRVPLVWRQFGESFQTGNGFFTVHTPGWYCPKCGAGYGGSKPKDRSGQNEFDFEEGIARARGSDPDTSHAAAESMRGEPAKGLERKGAEWLLAHREGGDAEEIGDDSGCKETSMTPRMCQLERKAIAFRAGIKKGKTGKDRVLWRHETYRRPDADPLQFSYAEASKLLVRGFYLEASHPLHGWVEAGYVPGHGLWGDERHVYRIRNPKKKDEEDE